MAVLSSLKPEKVFTHFEELSTIPRGSENMEKIAEFCMAFAKTQSLKAIKDSANNVIIFKPGTKGYEHASPVILQGHLDMVCQKTEDCRIDFLKEGLQLYVDGDYVKAKDTTLGADNGIAVAMIMTILESDDIPHPPIEAVFTTDEEIGMIGAKQLDMSVLKGKLMINLDAEEDDTLTVSCAGGSDFYMKVPLTREVKTGTEITVSMKALKGGHSGVEIHKGRVNANILAGRFLNHMNTCSQFHLISVDGGDKANAIPNACHMHFCVDDPSAFTKEAENYLAVIKEEIAQREPDFTYIIATGAVGTTNVINDALKNQLIYTLLCAPNGVTEMSAEIEGLVETSLNLGILKTENGLITLHFALRSNKCSALTFLEDKLTAFASCIPCTIETFGHYPPWEFKSDSKLQKLYKECFIAQFGFEPKVEAIHAGLECGVFASQIEGIDCIAMGPGLFDVHTVNEKLSISSTQQTFELLLRILKKCQ